MFQLVKNATAFGDLWSAVLFAKPGLSFARESFYKAILTI
jgi:hypothetical protein